MAMTEMRYDYQATLGLYDCPGFTPGEASREVRD